VIINGSDLAARTEQILVDLLSLEVNTIWSESITGERYPGVEQALHEVDKLYAERLGIAYSTANSWTLMVSSASSRTTSSA
jgi:hypothetical protein